MSAERDELRRAIYRELDEAVDRLKAVVPTAPAENALAISLAYFAELSARHLGHATTAEILITMAEHGFELAQQDEAATRN